MAMPGYYQDQQYQSNSKLSLLSTWVSHCYQRVCLIVKVLCRYIPDNVVEHHLTT